MSERPVTLDLSVTAGDVGLRDMATPRERQAANQGDVSRFAAALAGGAPADAEAPSVLPEGPMALLAGASRSPSTTATLAPLLSGVVSQLMVGDGSTSARSTRMTLSDDVLPGVVVAVYEEAGAWVAEFACSEDASYRLLAEAATDLAYRLAAELARDAVWRVKTDPEDETMTVEAFAAAPAGGER